MIALNKILIQGLISSKKNKDYSSASSSSNTNTCFSYTTPISHSMSLVKKEILAGLV